MPDQPVDSSTTQDAQRCCSVCGEPIYSCAKVHPACAAEAEGTKPLADEPLADGAKRNQAPQETCTECGHKSHVRSLACGRCGAMF